MAEEQAEVGSPNESLNEHDPHYEPIISLPEVCIPTLEEDEAEMIKLRAKLFRYDKNENPPEWKERGTGDIKLLRHREKNSVRVVMRRDKTLKLCANHFVTPWMELKPSHGSDRAWVYSVDGDFADGEMKQELLAVRFANSENAKKWKDKFEEAKILVEKECDLYRNGGAVKPDSEDDTDSTTESENEKDNDPVTTKEVNGSPSKVKTDTKEDNVVKDLEKLNVNENSSNSANE